MKHKDNLLCIPCIINKGALNEDAYLFVYPLHKQSPAIQLRTLIKYNLNMTTIYKEEKISVSRFNEWMNNNFYIMKLFIISMQTIDYNGKFITAILKIFF